MKTYLLILLFVLSIPMLNFAQMETLIDEGVEKTIEMKYISNSKERLNNMVIEKVAKAKALPVQATSLVYKVKEYQKIINKGSKLQLQLSIGHYVFDDDVVYMKFNINKYLLPSFISYTYVWSGGDDIIIESKSVRNERFKNGSFLINKKADMQTDLSSLKLYLSEVSFGFSENDFNKLDDFIKVVDAYYDADAQLNMIEQEISDMGIDSIEMLAIYKQQTLDNIKVFNQIRSSRYTSKLSLKTNDPIQFKSHFGRVEVLNRELDKELDAALKSMHITYYKKGVDWIEWGDIQKAKHFFEKSIAEKSDYAPPYYELAKMDFDNELYEKTIDSCSMVLNYLKPDTDTRYGCVQLSESVIKVFLGDIHILIEDKNYSMALERLDVCENYAKSIPGVKVFEEFNEIHSKLFQAYYSDLVKVTKFQIENVQLQQAQLNVDSLIEFRLIHKVFIQSPEREHNLLKDLYVAWIDNGKYYLEKSVTDSSLYALVQASALCRKHDVVYCTDELTELIHTARINQYNYMVNTCDTLLQDQLADSVLTLLTDAEAFRELNSLSKNDKVDTLFIQAQQIKYTEFITIGYDSYLASKSREALAFYDEAIALEKLYQIIIDTSLVTKTTLAARGYITLLCLQGETLVEALHINDAKQKLSASKNLYTYYAMADDVETTEAISKLERVLQNGVCEEVKHLYNIQVLSAKKFIEKKEFIYASKALDKAKQAISVESRCELVDLETSKIANEISSMLSYEKQMVEINDELINKEYSNTIVDYNNLTTFYYDSCENNFGIEHSNLFTYISTNSNKGLIDFGVRYYIELNNTDTALMLLDVLYTKDYIGTWSKQSQVELGVRLARDDIESDSNQDPKRKVLNYTKGKKWYKYLNKAYLNEWNNL